MDINLVLKDLKEIKLSSDTIKSITDEFSRIMSKHDIDKIIPGDDYDTHVNNPIWMLFMSRLATSIFHDIEMSCIFMLTTKG